METKKARWTTPRPDIKLSRCRAFPLRRVACSRGPQPCTEGPLSSTLPRHQTTPKRPAGRKPRGHLPQERPSQVVTPPKSRNSLAVRPGPDPEGPGPGPPAANESRGRGRGGAAAPRSPGWAARSRPPSPIASFPRAAQRRRAAALRRTDSASRNLRRPFACHHPRPASSKTRRRRASRWTSRLQSSGQRSAFRGITLARSATTRSLGIVLGAFQVPEFFEQQGNILRNPTLPLHRQANGKVSQSHRSKPLLSLI